MNTSKINRVLSEYMGAKELEDSCDGGNFALRGIVPFDSGIAHLCKDFRSNTPVFLPRFDLSLDSQLPIIEKLGVSGIKIDRRLRDENSRVRWRVRCLKALEGRESGISTSISQACAYSLANLIETARSN